MYADDICVDWINFDVANDIKKGNLCLRTINKK